MNGRRRLLSALAAVLALPAGCSGRSPGSAKSANEATIDRLRVTLEEPAYSVSIDRIAPAETSDALLFRWFPEELTETSVTGDVVDIYITFPEVLQPEATFSELDARCHTEAGETVASFRIDAEWAHAVREEEIDSGTYADRVWETLELSGALSSEDGNRSNDPDGNRSRRARSPVRPPAARGDPSAGDDPGDRGGGRGR
jgi:hypothetical protein